MSAPSQPLIVMRICLTLLDGFLAVQADRRRGALDAAVALLSAVNGAVDVYASQWARATPNRQPPVFAALAAINDSVVTYTLAVRAGLGYDRSKRRAPQ